MKIVKFKNGTYGIRRGVFKLSYLDLVNLDGWYAYKYLFTVFNKCQSKVLEDVKNIYDLLTDKGKPIKNNK